MTERHDRDILSAGHLDEPAGDATRRRRRRTVAATVAVAAIILGLVVATHPWRVQHGPSFVFSPVNPGPVAVPLPMPTALPGTVLASCNTASVGQAGAANLQSNWRQWSTEAGPLWFANLGGHSKISGRAALGTASVKPVLYVVIVVLTGIQPGTAVAVRTTPAGRPYLRFLYGPDDSLNAGTVYTMHSGESGVTFPMCPQQGGNAAAPFTDYYGGLLVAGARCVPVDIWPPHQSRAITVALGACH